MGRETRFRADILAKREVGNQRETLLIECKSSRVISSARISDIISQLKTYGTLYEDCRLVLAIPRTLREQDQQALKAQNIEGWDLDFLATNFVVQIQEVSLSYYKAFFLSRIGRGATPTREQKLLRALRACQPGKKDWHVYQSVVGDILEYLFTPPLAKPIPELSDKTLSNRRDFILPNYAEKGFWSFMRDKYEADYIVVDAKNYTRKVKKAEVLQIANYLKSHGAGLFGVIVCREGGDSAGCEHTLREQWLIHRKLIIVLDDDDVEAMLIAKSDGRSPEEVIGRKIEQFRLAM